MKHYTPDEVDKFLDGLRENGYTLYNMQNGERTSGDWICCPMDDKQPYYMIREIIYGDGKSGQRIRRIFTLSNNTKMMIEKAKKGGE